MFVLGYRRPSRDLSVVYSQQHNERNEKKKKRGEKEKQQQQTH